MSVYFLDDDTFSGCDIFYFEDRPGTVMVMDDECAAHFALALRLSGDHVEIADEIDVLLRGQGKVDSAELAINLHQSREVES